MFKEFKVLNSHGRQYIGNLRRQPVSALFRGKPVIDGAITDSEIEQVSLICPVRAVDRNTGAIDIGRCMFCKECSLLFPHRISFTNDYRIAVNKREDLIIKPGSTDRLKLDETVVRRDARRLFRKALKLRQISAGGDNSCEMELNAAGNVNFDVGRFGIEFVASPRHADGIVITGPVTENMAEALEICYEAVPSPKLIILVGTDAISASMWEGSKAINRKFIDNHNIDLYVPGNPAHPLTFINGVMDLLGKK